MSEALLDRAGLSRRWFTRGRTGREPERSLDRLPADSRPDGGLLRLRSSWPTSGWRPAVVLLNRGKDRRLKLEDPFL
jgi:hypothetical protein